MGANPRAMRTAGARQSGEKRIGMTNGESRNASGAGPEEVEVELVGETSSDAPPPIAAAAAAGPATARALKPRILVAAAGLAILTLAAAAFWILKPRLALPEDRQDGGVVAPASAPPQAAARPAEAPAGKIANLDPAGAEARALPPEAGPALPPPPGADSRLMNDVPAPPDEEAPPADQPAAERAAAPAPPDDPGAAAASAAAADTDALALLEAEAAAREAAEAGGAAVSAPPVAPGPDGAAETAPTAAEADVPSAEIAALTARFEAETARLAAELGAERARAEMQAAEIAALRSEIGAARAAPAGPAAEPSAASAVLALLALARAIEDGRPFKTELARLERLAGASPAARRLAAAAETGAPTRAALKERFPDLARKALADDARARADGPFGAVLAGLVRVVTVMPARPTPGAGAAAILSRAKGRLAADDVAGAAGEIDALVGAAAAVFADWRADALRHVEARAALADLNAELLDGGAARGAP
jgi:hypothetical protein